MPDSPSANLESPRRKHDEVYKFFFSQTPTIAEVLEDYVVPDCVDQLDLATPRKLTPERVGSQLARRQADMLWRIDFRHQPGFMILLLEFQSRIDPSMGARILGYVADTYEDLIREKQPGGDLRLPPVVACVVYNGGRRWHAPLDMAELISPTLAQLRDRSVQLPYQVLDMRAPPRRSLRKRRILTWLRELEREGGTVEKVRAVLDEVLEAYPGPEHARIAEAFKLWTVGAARRWGGSKEELSKITTLSEAREMYTLIEEEMARLRDEGRRRGRREGHREARLRLERQVAKKFGAAAAVQLSGLIGGMDGRDELDAAADAVIECDSVAELLARLAN